ncbi:hypothetical protein, conserved [Eimeria tenella]|uniref:Uncharacterized protein n=1 Tax=Eimeria tenella TaxID=5802 RepID=U6L279_EIMTE|nr:hypothetical protein, conserved [Eimeria tenella]CDJ42709.1 hypothetical protein, conserved [Eimeria tenella]|eukprot:XP_013233459.1 hypothetical protein, conserved [Eimeria tenella]
MWRCRLVEIQAWAAGGVMRHAGLSQGSGSMPKGTSLGTNRGQKDAADTRAAVAAATEGKNPLCSSGNSCVCLTRLIPYMQTRQALSDRDDQGDSGAQGAPVRRKKMFYFALP